MERGGEGERASGGEGRWRQLLTTNDEGRGRREKGKH